MIARAGLVLSVVHSSAMKMELQTTTLHALEIAEAKRACQHQLE